MSELIDITVDTDSEWKKWYREVENRTYVISHDLDKWHVPGKATCVLYARIKRKFQKWKGSKCLVRHNPAKDKLEFGKKLPFKSCPSENLQFV